LSKMLKCGRRKLFLKIPIQTESNTAISMKWACLPVCVEQNLPCVAFKKYIYRHKQVLVLIKSHLLALSGIFMVLRKY
jgi:hypothetical protein